MKPNQKELSALVQRDLSQPDDVRLAAQSLIQSGKVRRVVVSLGPQGALGVDASGQRSGSAATDEKPEHRRRWRQHGGAP
ncbi:6-phosphofructokinase class II [Klebsiella pneumoniae]|uniref:6-phosphofructokinase class II n=1 Tax=Klebsiella pneumoniae TaxID=573 RepID=A0A447S7C8_KLEPN|nr:6-phosphofructokinase class II [Klebsiella pneumoniae]